MNMEELIGKYNVYLQDMARSEKTIKAYNRNLKEFATYFNYDMSKLTNKSLREYKEFLQNKIQTISKKPLSFKSINQHISSVKSFFTYLNLYEDAHLNFIFKLLKLEQKPYLENTLTMDEYKKILAASKGDIRAWTLIQLLYNSGARTSEALQIKTSDVGEDTYTAHCKGAKIREIYLTHDLNKILKRYKKVRIDNSPFLFTGKKGKLTTSTINAFMTKYGALAGVDPKKCFPHNLRHFYALKLAKEGFRLDQISQYLGHSNVNTTAIYLQIGKPEMLANLEKALHC